MAWTEMGQKQIGELNIASVWFFSLPCLHAETEQQFLNI